MIGFYNSAVSTARAAAAPEEAKQLAELSALIEMSLGHPIDRETLNALRRIQATLWRTRSELVQRLRKGELTPHQYLDGLNASLKSAMEESRLLLGDQRFQAIFGEAGSHPEGLVDPNTFMEQTIADA